VLIMMIAIQLKETWILLAVLSISILTSKDLSTVVAFMIAAVVLYFFVGSGSEEMWPVVIFGLIIISIILSSKAEPEKDYAGGGYGDLFGGMGGGGY